MSGPLAEAGPFTHGSWLWKQCLLSQSQCHLQTLSVLGYMSAIDFYPDSDSAPFSEGLLEVFPLSVPPVLFVSVVHTFMCCCSCARLTPGCGDREDARLALRCCWHRGMCRSGAGHVQELRLLKECSARVL